MGYICNTMAIFDFMISWLFMITFYDTMAIFDFIKLKTL